MIKKSTNRPKIAIPKNGKIGSLAKNIEKESSRSVMLEVMRNVGKFESTFDRGEKAEWIKGAIERLEKQVDKKTATKIMENCGIDCCRKHARYKKLIKESKSIEEFLDKLSTGGFQFKLKDKNAITNGCKPSF